MKDFVISIIYSTSFGPKFGQIIAKQYALTLKKSLMMREPMSQRLETNVLNSKTSLSLASPVQSSSLCFTNGNFKVVLQRYHKSMVQQALLEFINQIDYKVAIQPAAKYRTEFMSNTEKLSAQ